MKGWSIIQIRSEPENDEEASLDTVMNDATLQRGLTSENATASGTDGRLCLAPWGWVIHLMLSVCLGKIKSTGINLHRPNSQELERYTRAY